MQNVVICAPLIIRIMVAKGANYDTARSLLKDIGPSGETLVNT